MEIAPDKKTLENMLVSAYQMPNPQARDVIITQITSIIKEFALPYAISNKQIIDTGDSTEACLSRFITQDEAMIAMKEKVRKLALINEDEHQLFSVLITGETGTGKELIARALHGDRPSKFLAINCAGLPSELIESELFGHVKGSFTSADRDKQGLMKAVGTGGTLFLDEIGELPLQVQAKLLRAIQSMRIRKVGDEKEIDINCRLVCATRQPIEAMASAQPERFRLDLFARISTYTLHITPLRERMNDVTLILKSLEGGEEFLTKLRTDKTLDLKLNVRSLQQYVKRYNIFGELP